MLRYCFYIIVFSLHFSQAMPQTGVVIPLWPADHPAFTSLPMNEEVTERSRDPLIKNRAVRKIAEPSIEVFIPDSPCGTSILICPGGAYACQAFDKEGTDIARWLNTLGITACVLKYRLPSEGHANGKDVPLKDAQRALRILRASAAEWNIDPAKIGVMGFSAGGHLASSLGTGYSRTLYEKGDSIDFQSARPDFMVLGYPVISMQDGITHKGSRMNLLGSSPTSELLKGYSTDQQIDPRTPLAFIFLAGDDNTVIPENSIRFYQELIKHNIPAELHIFEQGGHGFGLRDLQGNVAEWPGLCKKWLQGQGMVPGKLIIH